MALRAPRGTSDLLGNEASAWNSIRQTAFDLFARYGYAPIETPTFEQLDVFVRGIGEATDVVGKEMFLVQTKATLDKVAAGEKLGADEALALRPEMTAGVARATVQNGLVPPGAATVKLVYAAPMYRHERPQKGRLREFHQIGAECLGASEPSADAEVIVMLMRFFEAAGIERSSMRLLVNSMGDDACRPAYRKQVRDYILEHSEDLCPECLRRADTNPLRAFDCKNPDCKTIMADAPYITDVLCDECHTHYAAVKDLLTAAGLEYEEDPRLVRGLDYYTRTVFEVQVTDGLGSQNAIGGGGRYDKLIEEFGGKPTPGLGFAVGFERILLALEAQDNANFAPEPPQVFIAAIDEATRAAAFSLAQQLRDAGLSVELDHQNRSLKSQFKLADKYGVSQIVVVGPDELAQGTVILRSMDTHEEQQIRLEDLPTVILHPNRHSRLDLESSDGVADA
jgi:histidyl-tRNA synthetase